MSEHSFGLLFRDILELTLDLFTQEDLESLFETPHLRVDQVRIQQYDMKKERKSSPRSWTVKRVFEGRAAVW